MIKELTTWKKPLVTALFALIVAPHIAFGAPAKLTRPVWGGAPVPVTWTMATPMPLPPWAVAVKEGE